jgi:hypothetical protein
VLVFCLAYTSPVSYTEHDARPSLLVSQAILEHRTIRLDAYRNLVQFDVGAWAFEADNGHLYYYWPVGPSILAGPLVWTLNYLGKDMSVIEWNDWAQNALSALSCALVFLIIYHIGRSYLRPGASLAIAMISVLGSALLSTMGTAFWNIGFAVLFVALSLLLICRFEHGRDEHPNPYVLGSLLFGAFFCRPTAASFVAVVLVYLLLRSRGTFVKTAATAGTLLALFVLWSWLEYGRLLPPYYSAGRFGTYPLPAWRALYAHLLSPSRGLLAFSPFFIPVLVSATGLFRYLRKDPLFWIAIVWLGLHIAIASNAERWWGGHSFGPRLVAEVIPALILITIQVWHALSPGQRVGKTPRAGASTARPRAQAAFVASYLFLGVVAIWINTGQGLYNRHTEAWNGGIMAPDVDRHHRYLLDWRYPQFLASNRSLCQRNRTHLARHDPADLAVYRLGELITHRSGLDDVVPASRAPAEFDSPNRSSPLSTQATYDTGTAFPSNADHRLAIPLMARSPQQGTNALFVGWAWPERGFRWTACRSASIWFRIEDVEVGHPLTMEILAGSFGEQDIAMSVNGARIGTLALDGEPAWHSLAFGSELLARDGTNALEFWMPDAASPDNPEDTRLLGLKLIALRLHAPP